MSLRMVIPYP